jgi:acid phosphatase
MLFRLLFLIVILCLPSGCGGSGGVVVPRPAHVVVVIEENKTFEDVAGSTEAPYINELASQGALMEQSYALTHPSLPNYLALFSGSTYGIADDNCRHDLEGPNLARALEEVGLGFTIYSEDLPETGSRSCLYLDYRRKHNPAAYFPSLPAEINRPLSDFPTDFSKLPAVSFVIPNLRNDMHDGSIRRGDAWLREHLDPYVQWARDHDSLLILTFDEDDHSRDNRVLTVFAGAHVRTGRYPLRIDHYDILSTLAAFYGIPAPGKAAKRNPIFGIWSD